MNKMSGNTEILLRKYREGFEVVGLGRYYNCRDDRDREEVLDTLRCVLLDLGYEVRLEQVTPLHNEGVVV